MDGYLGEGWEEAEAAAATAWQNLVISDLVRRRRKNNVRTDGRTDRARAGGAGAGGHTNGRM